jgi:hypothetical protein
MMRAARHSPRRSYTAVTDGRFEDAALGLDGKEDEPDHASLTGHLALGRARHTNY